MATAAFNAYCFECLSASFDKRKPLPFSFVIDLWADYEALADEDEPGASHSAPGQPVGSAATYRPAAISRILAPSPSSSSSSSAPSASSSTPSLNTNLSSDTSQASSKSTSNTSLLSLPGRLSKAVPPPKKIEEYPLFVTWDSRSRSGHKNLRGCIGTFDAQELDDGLRSYALTSAFDDSRFMPIAQRELPSLECSVTLLTNFEPISDPMDWEIGKHGLRINFNHNNRRFGATYLPDVAREQGWTKDETMVSLMRKAGWNGRRDDWRSVSNLTVVRYQGSKSSLGYREWREWRDWVEETGRDEMES